MLSPLTTGKVFVSSLTELWTLVMRIIACLWFTLLFSNLGGNLAADSLFFTDSLHILAIRVEFSEDNSPYTTGVGKFDLSQTTVPYQIDPPPHGKAYFEDHLLFLRNYYTKISAGKLQLSAEVYPESADQAYQLEQSMTHYNPNRTPDENNAGLARLFRDAIQKADEDPAIDFSRFQSFIVFHAGVGKDVDLGFDETPQDIPSLFITSDFLREYLGIPAIEVDNGSFQIPNGIIAPETESQVGIELGLNGILTANFASQLGWLDLFSPQTRRSGVGRFDLMDVGLFNSDGLLPALPSAWTRINAGWETPFNISYALRDEFTVYSTLSTASEKTYRIPINENEYFLVENRYAGRLNFDSLQYELSINRPESATAREVLETYFADQVTFSSRGVLIDVENPDLGLPGSGCLIWHIDERVIEANRQQNQVNADPDHRGVDLEEADGSQDIGQAYDFLSPGYGSEIGWILDMWYTANSSPVFKNVFSSSSQPDSRSYYHRANSHIKISDFSAPDTVMTFKVEINIFQRNFPVQIDPQVYGKIISMKNTDLDFDGKRDVILLTDQGKILTVNETGYSSWGSDSFLVGDIGRQLIVPPVLFNNPYRGALKSKGLVVLANDGTISGFSFLADHTIERLFIPISINSNITTHPLGTIEADSTVRIYWGTETGYIFQLNIEAGWVALDSLLITDEAIRFLHLNAQDQLIIVGQSGRVFRDNTYLRQINLPYSSPVGEEAVAVTRQGEFLLLESESNRIAEENIFCFDSPMITNPFLKGAGDFPSYFVTGNNRLYSFNYNFTQSADFPVRIYDPDNKVTLPLTPLLNLFFDQSARQVVGLLVTDPLGVIDGFDLSGNRLADFPLAVGDSLLISPILTDIDEDGDLEIAAVTKKGILYLWDLASPYDRFGWNQLYYDELNSNRNNNPLPDNPYPPDERQYDQLLPEKLVYNWPNPNIENYTFIRYYLTDEAQVRIKIYDLAGDLVSEFPGSGYPRTDNEIRWDLQSVQSGVYLARIEAKSNNKQEVRMIKIAVVK
jgi:M6 family metalloprotease-like protein